MRKKFQTCYQVAPTWSDDLFCPKFSPEMRTDKKLSGRAREPYIGRIVEHNFRDLFLRLKVALKKGGRIFLYIYRYHNCNIILQHSKIRYVYQRCSNGVPVVAYQILF